MNLQQLREKGGIVSPLLVKTEVSWTHPAEDGSEVTDTFTIHVRKHSFGMIERLFASDGTESDRSYAAAFLSSSVMLGDDGEDALSYEDAYQLVPGLAKVMMDAVNKVNGTRDAVKN